MFVLFLFCVLASLHFEIKHKFRSIFFLQTAINIWDAGCKRRVCKAAEPEGTKAGVNIYEAFSHQIFDNRSLREGSSLSFFSFFLRKTPFCRERINRKCQCWSRSCVCWSHSGTANYALYIVFSFFFQNLYPLPHSPLPPPPHSSVLLICRSLPSSSIPPSSPHSVTHPRPSIPDRSLHH